MMEKKFIIKNIRQSVGQLLSHRMIRLNLMPALVTIVVGILLAWEVWLRLTPKYPPIEEPRYLVARRDLGAGLPVYFPDFTFLPRSQWKEPVIPEGALTDQDLHRLKGATLLHPLKSNTILSTKNLILDTKALGARVPNGLRAYLIHPVERVPLRRGDYVDVVLRNIDDHGTSQTVIQGIEILEAQLREDRFEVLVAASREEIEMLESFANSGKLTLTLRNPQEPIPKSRSVNRRKHRSTPKAAEGIQVWVEAE